MNFKRIILLAGSVIMIVLLVISVDSQLDITGNVISKIPLFSTNDSNPDKLTPDQISSKLDDSLDNLELKDNELDRLNESISKYKENLEQILDSYNLLGSDLMSSVMDANRIANRIEKTQQETEEVKRELSSIKEAVRIGQLGNNFNYTKNEGSSTLFIFFGILTIINSGLFIFSIFYSKRRSNGFI